MKITLLWKIGEVPVRHLAVGLKKVYSTSLYQLFLGQHHLAMEIQLDPLPRHPSNHLRPAKYKAIITINKQNQIPHLNKLCRLIVDTILYSSYCMTWKVDILLYNYLTTFGQILLDKFRLNKKQYSLKLRVYSEFYILYFYSYS